MNRILEYKLRQLEMLWSLLSFKNYPAEQLENLWKDILLYQFHSILPGSSINHVYRDSREHYKRDSGEAAKPGWSKSVKSAKGLLVYC